MVELNHLNRNNHNRFNIWNSPWTVVFPQYRIRDIKNFTKKKLSTWFRLFFLRKLESERAGVELLQQEVARVIEPLLDQASAPYIQVHTYSTSSGGTIRRQGRLLTCYMYVYFIILHFHCRVFSTKNYFVIFYLISGGYT